MSVRLSKTNMQIPPFMAFLTTMQCNLNCRVCSERVQKQTDPAPTLEIGKKLADLKQHGLKTLALSGGEPLMHHKLGQLIGILREGGLKLNLITNGSMLEDNLDLLSQIDKICLTLFSVNSDVNKYLRGRQGSIENVIDLIDTVTNINPSTLIQLNTPVTKMNIEGLSDLGKFIMSGEIKADAWLLLKFIAAENTSSWKLKDKLGISDEEFHGAVKEMKGSFPQPNVISSLPALTPTNVIHVEPDGLVTNRNNGTLDVLGNIIQEHELVISRLHDLYLNQQDRIYSGD